MAKKTYHTTLGPNLRQLREKYGVSAIQLSDYLGITKNPHQIISSWETGRREPTFVQLCMIADYFGVSTEFLLGRKQMDLAEEISAYLAINNKKLTQEDRIKIMNAISLLLK